MERATLNACHLHTYLHIREGNNLKIFSASKIMLFKLMFFFLDIIYKLFTSYVYLEFHKFLLHFVSAQKGWTTLTRSCSLLIMCFWNLFTSVKIVSQKNHLTTLFHYWMLEFRFYFFFFLLLNAINYLRVVTTLWTFAFLCLIKLPADFTRREVSNYNILTFIITSNYVIHYTYICTYEHVCVAHGLAATTCSFCCNCDLLWKLKVILNTQKSASGL